jgi:hypothetical protein
MLRQGDVLLVPVQNIPAAATPVQRDQGRIVLAYGEATGHAHAISEPGVEILEYERTHYLRVPKEGACLVHEEHGPIALAPGDYEVRIQREYTPEAIRTVVD